MYHPPILLLVTGDLMVVFATGQTTQTKRQNNAEVDVKAALQMLVFKEQVKIFLSFIATK